MWDWLNVYSWFSSRPKGEKTSRSWWAFTWGGSGGCCIGKGMYLLLPWLDLWWVTCIHGRQIYLLDASWCLLKDPNNYLSEKAPEVVPIHSESMGEVTCIHNYFDWGSLAGSIGCSGFPSWTPWGPNVDQNKGPLSPNSNCSTGDGSHQTCLPCVRELCTSLLSISGSV